jgi:hypothetical protein
MKRAGPADSRQFSREDSANLIFIVVNVVVLEDNAGPDTGADEARYEHGDSFTSMLDYKGPRTGRQGWSLIEVPITGAADAGELGLDVVYPNFVGFHISPRNPKFFVVLACASSDLQKDFLLRHRNQSMIQQMATVANEYTSDAFTVPSPAAPSQDCAASCQFTVAPFDPVTVIV